MINSYPSIYNLGHAAIATLLHGPVLVEEKVDGSQISFGLREDADCAVEGTYDLVVRSKGAQINLIAPEGMFKKAVEILQGVRGAMRPGYTYRGEYLSKPAHNVLAYDHVPNNHIVIFDIEYGQQSFVGLSEKKRLAGEIGMGTVPVLGIFEANELTPDTLRMMLDKESVLGGQKIEGVVIKPLNYDLFGRDKKVLMAKFVSEHFKEVHATEWKKEHGPKSCQDIIGEIAIAYGTPARWAKALIHLREAGLVTDSLKDIGLLVAEIPKDIEKECSDELKDLLFKWAWPQIRRSVTRGLPQWYKELLLKLQFERTGGDAPSAMLAAGLSALEVGTQIHKALEEARTTPEYAAEGLELEKFPAAGDIGIDPDKLAQLGELNSEIERLESEGGPVVPQEWGATTE